MGISLTTNVAAFGAQRALARNDSANVKSLARLSSGYRINSAADDASGLAISEGLRARMRGMSFAVRNAQDGVSVVQTADGALGGTADILHRMRDLAVQGANDGALGTHGKAAIQSELNQLKAQLGSVFSTAQWNGTNLLDGTYSRQFQVGSDVGETISVVIGMPGGGLDAAGLGVATVDVTGGVTMSTTVTPAVSAAQGTPAPGRMNLAGDFVTPGVYQASFAGLAGTVSYNGRSFDLGSVDYTGAVTATEYLGKLDAAARPALGTGVIPFSGSATALMFGGDTPGASSTAADAASLTPSYTGQSGASAAISLIDKAIDGVSSLRAYLGGVQNRLEHTISRLDVAIENTTASESRIRDTDMAIEMSTYSRGQILVQAGTSMLAQATQAPQALLKLLN
jgi:flagellin-like hook-associated protein FlgL